MIKILKQGIIPKPWYTEGTWNCSNCSCMFRLEENDESVPRTGITVLGNEWAALPCPTCGEDVYKNDVTA